MIGRNRISVAKRRLALRRIDPIDRAHAAAAEAGAADVIGAMIAAAMTVSRGLHRLIDRTTIDAMSIVRALKGTSITISNRRHVARSRKNRCASAPNANLAVKIGSRSADAAAAVAEVVHATATKSGASLRLDRQTMSSRHRPMPA